MRALPQAGSFLVGMWALAIALLPFYQFDSGLPQVADWLLAGVGVCVLLLHGPVRDENARKAVGLMALMVAYILGVNTLYYVSIGDRRFLFSTAFFGFNLLVLHTFLRLYEMQGRRLLKWTLGAVMVSLVVPVLLAPVAPGTQRRATLFFNNPNQLAYFALAAMSALAILARHLRLGTKWLIPVFATGTLMGFVSVSRSGLAGALLVVLLYAVQRLRDVVIVVLLAVPVFGWLMQQEQAELWEMRMEQGVGPVEAEVAEERGFDRIARYPQYLFLGAGEGGYHRFDPDRYMEIHSSLAALAFSYGLPGTVLFVLLMRRAMVLSSWRLWVFLLPSFAYGFYHQGLRSRMFWIIVALLVALGSGSWRTAPGIGTPPPRWSSRAPRWAPRRVRDRRWAPGASAASAPPDDAGRGSGADIAP